MFQGVISGRIKFKKFEPLSKEVTLPPPNGVFLRVWPLEAMDTTKGGLLLDSQSREDEERGVTIGYVEAVGTLAYSNDKFQGVKYCQPGDYILFARHQGLDFEIKGRHFKLIVDDRPVMTFSEQQLKDLGVINE